MTVEERIAVYEAAFIRADGDDVIGDAELSYLSEALTGSTGGESEFDLEEVAWAFESLGIQALNAELPEERVVSVFDRAFRSRRALWALRHRTLSVEDAWLLAASGTLANRQPELRQLLAELDWDETFGNPPSQWDEHVLWQSARALLHLARKADGWGDINRALDALRELGELQAEAQQTFLSTEIESAEEERIFVVLDEEGRPQHQTHDSDAQPFHERLRVHQRLLGLYHLAEALLAVGTYLRSGGPDGVIPVLQRHGEHCRHLLSQAGDERLARIGQTVAPVTTAMARASVWANTSRLSEAARQFVRHLTHEGHAHPVLELWWSQREALSQNLLDPFQRAVSVQMPTSAGKTLLAEFAIVQSLALNPTSTVAYVVPTRALVSQITKRMRADLEGVSRQQGVIRVETAVPVFELDPTEDLLLQQAPDVLVTTPEKLDLLVRSSHQAVADLSLVVVDEAHHISDPTRGARLELLLGTLKRERGERCRFLLLTPFLPNAGELAEWLGDAEHTTIELNWRPSEQIRAVGTWRREGGTFHNHLAIVPSATQPSSWAGFGLDLGDAAIPSRSVSRTKLSASLAIALSEAEHGGVLVLTKGPGTAESRAQEIAAAADLLNANTDDDRALLRAASDYIASELGEDYPLLATLQRGVAYHHAGLPPEIRGLVESLLEHGVVRAVAGTTTLAQGVNFPLAAVVIELLKVPQRRGLPWRPLRYAEFWNIAGRAGRALHDRVGTVVWPATSRQQSEEFVEYLRGEAADVVSALSAAITQLSGEGVELNLQLVRNQPALSHFLQYLAHALRVAGYDRAVGEIEDILRSSLAYRRLRRDDHEVAENLVRWARSFLGEIRNARYLPISDATGFSLPSVGLIAGTAPDEIRTPAFWNPGHLFGEDLAPFTQLIEVLSAVPELSLASDAPGGINAARVAGIVRDWVRGATLPNIATAWYPNQPLGSALQDAGKYLFRDLVGQVPWGLGALQAIGLGTDDSEDETIRDARRVPAMTFYGVAEAHALPLRMVGVPRAAAAGLGELAPDFASFAEARDWVAALPEASWDVAGRARGLSGATLRRVWMEVGGTAA